MVFICRQFVSSAKSKKARFHDRFSFILEKRAGERNSEVKSRQGARPIKLTFAL